jgi:serine phosphatase RsbU (regulator of sigma subunit)
MGIDLSVVYYNSKNKEIVYSGAQNPVFIISNNNLIEIKASPISIGFTDQESIKEENKYFTNKHIPINDGDVLYLFSDGFYNQTGEETGRKFMKNKFKDLLLSVYKEPFTVQKQHLEKTFVEWKGKELQTDDILIAGIRF